MSDYYDDSERFAYGVAESWFTDEGNPVFHDLVALIANLDRRRTPCNKEPPPSPSMQSTPAPAAAQGEVLLGASHTDGLYIRSQQHKAGALKPADWWEVIRDAIAAAEARGYEQCQRDVVAFLRERFSTAPLGPPPGKVYMIAETREALAAVERGEHVGAHFRDVAAKGAKGP